MIKDKFISGIKWNGAATLIGGLCHFATIIILARILTPFDFGLVAAGLIWIRVGMPLTDFGLSKAIIQADDTSREVLNSIFWIQVIIGISLFLVTFFVVSYWIQEYFEIEHLSIFVQYLSLAFLISPIGIVYQGLLQKNLNFDRLGVIQMIGFIGEFVVAVLVAWKYQTAMALVYGYLIRLGLNTIGYWHHGRNYFKVGNTLDLKRSMSSIKFGLYEMSGQFVSQINNQVDKLLIARFLGAEALGYYVIAWEIIMLPLTKINPIINKIMFPIFSFIKKEAKDFNYYYRLTLSVLAWINIPVFVVIIITAPVLLKVLFGDQWVLSATVLSILGLAGVYRSLSATGASVLLSKGRSDMLFYWNVLALIIITLGTYLVLLRWPSIENVAWIQVGAFLILGPVWHYLVMKIGRIEYWRVFKEISLPMLLFFVCLVIFYMLGHNLNSVDSTSSLLISIVGVGVLYGLGLLGKIYLTNMKS